MKVLGALLVPGALIGKHWSIVRTETLPDENVKVDSDESEEGAREVDLALHVDRHVHADQPLVG